MYTQYVDKLHNCITHTWRKTPRTHKPSFCPRASSIRLYFSLRWTRCSCAHKTAQLVKRRFNSLLVGYKQFLEHKQKYKAPGKNLHVLFLLTFTVSPWKRGVRIAYCLLFVLPIDFEGALLGYDSDMLMRRLFEDSYQQCYANSAAKLGTR